MQKFAADRLAFYLLLALFAVAFAFGAGGIGAPLGNLTVQLTALVLLALVPTGVTRFWREAPLVLRLLVIAAVALPLIQLILLPESLWNTLPSRSMVTRSLERAGEGGWMPLSVDPRRTLLAATALVTPLAVLCAGWTLPRERLLDIGWAIVGLGLLTVVLGAVQLSNASGTATLYGVGYTRQVLVGTFANRNSVGLFLTFAVGLAALLPAPRRHPAVLPARLAACAMLLLGVFLTQSRTAIVLALLPVLLGAARGLGAALQGRAPAAARAAMIGLGAIALVGATAGALVVAAPGRIGEALERFEAKDDPRRFIWDDATFMAGRYWPTGAGVGTFDEIYQVDESLENLTKRRPGRAHNDYIELTIEAGAPGLVLLALWMVTLIWLSWRVRRSSQRWAGWAGSAFLLTIALQSITDYPLRNQAMLAFAAYALLLVTRIATEPARGRP